MSGWEQLGEVLGGGIDRAGAFEQGRLRSAQTEGALGLARQRQLENIALETKNRERERTRETLAASGMDPAQADLLANVMLGEMGSDFKAGTEGMGEIQTQGFRSTLADPEAPLGDQFAAGQGLQEQVLPRYAITGQTAEDLFNRDAPLAPTPVGQAQIGLDQARANDPDLRNWGSPSSGGSATSPGGVGKPPSGFIMNPAFDATKPVGEGNYPFIDAKQPVMGAREGIFFNRVVGGAKNAQQTIKNIVGLPVGASAGVFGIGSKPGDSMFTAGVDTLRNTVASQDVQTYNSMIAGLDANLAQIEGHGLAASDAFRGQYDRLALREGDTEFTRLRKLAEMAQTIQSGLDPYLRNPRIPVEQKQYIADVLAAVQETIPFTHEDIARLEVAPGTATLGSLIQSKGLNAPASPGAAPAPAAAAPGAAPQIEAWERGPDGKLRRVGAQ